MDEERENPFASPESAAEPMVVDPVEWQGRMPGSVKVAIGCLIATALFEVISGVTFYSVSGLFPVFEASVFCLSIGMVLAVLSRGRLAWLATSILLAVVGALTATAFVYELATMPANGTTVTTSSMTVDPTTGDPTFVQTTTVYEYGAVGLAAGLMLLFCPWIALVALNRTTALKYFQLICPGCGSRRVRSADLLYRKAKCRDCGEVG